MASASSIAIRVSAAQTRLLAAAAEISRLTGAPAPEWPRHKDTDILRALEMETAAGLLEDAARALRMIPPAPAAVSVSGKRTGRTDRTPRSDEDS